MTAFSTLMSSRLPAGVVLPPSLAELFDWIEAQGWVRTPEQTGEPFGTLGPGRSWTQDGTSVSFHVEPPERQRESARLWLGVPGLHDRLVPFARTGGDGSQAAFWLDDDGRQRIVHLGSGSGSVLTCVLADDPDDFLRLLAIGYDEVCWLYEEQFAEPPDREDGHDPVNRPFVDWVTARGLGVPSQARELVPNPAQMTDEDNPDPFWQWLRRVCRW